MKDDPYFITHDGPGGVCTVRNTATGLLIVTNLNEDQARQVARELNAARAAGAVEGAASVRYYLQKALGL